MIQGLPRYFTHGLPASSTIVFKKGFGDLSNDCVVTISGDIYTYQVDFFGRRNDAGSQPASTNDFDPFLAAKTLTAAINSDLNTPLGVQTIRNPIKSYYAIYFGTTVYVISTQPGFSRSQYVTITGTVTAAATTTGAFTGGKDNTQQSNTGAVLVDKYLTGSPGTFVSCYVYNSAAAQQFVCLYDTLAVINVNSVPKLFWPIAAQTGQIFSFQWRCNNGIAIANNKTATPWATRDAGPVADLFVALNNM